MWVRRTAARTVAPYPPCSVLAARLAEREPQPAAEHDHTGNDERPQRNSTAAGFTRAVGRGAGRARPSWVRVNVRVPLTGCPSADVTRNATVYTPAGPSSPSSALTVGPSTAGSPLVHRLPSGPTTVRDANDSCSASLNVTLTRSGPAAISAPFSGVELITTEWASAVPAPSMLASMVSSPTAITFTDVKVVRLLMSDGSGPWRRDRGPRRVRPGSGRCRPASGRCRRCRMPSSRSPRTSWRRPRRGCGLHRSPRPA